MQLAQQSFEGFMKYQAGCINRTCMALTPLPFSMENIRGSNSRPFDRKPSLLPTGLQRSLFILY